MHLDQLPQKLHKLRLRILVRRKYFTEPLRQGHELAPADRKPAGRPVPQALAIPLPLHQPFVLVLGTEQIDQVDRRTAGAERTGASVVSV